MKILVYGAGNMGSLYAALLQESGQEVSVLARGTRLTDLRDHGIRLQSEATGQQTDVRVDAVERLEAGDAYDLVLVVLPGDRVSQVLPILAANRETPSVMFFGNNAAGPDEMIDALGRNRVLLGFPGAAAVRRDDRLHYVITSAQEQPTTLGELDGAESPRIAGIADAMNAAGFHAAVCLNMDAWLKTHVAKILPTAYALYMAGGDPRRLARTRDALVLMIRAMREGFEVLEAHGVPITPANHRVLPWLPEPLLLAIMRGMLGSDAMSIKIGHATEARDEMRALDDELRALAASTAVATPATDRLRGYLDPSMEPMADGSAELSLHWGGVWAVGLGLAALAALLAI